MKTFGKVLHAGLTSWKTTAAGAIGFTIILLRAAQFLWDGDETTVVDVDATMQALTGLVVLLWGLFARDADKSSQDSGVRK